MKSFIINGNNITKFYGKNVVLQNLNINIKKGSITGLIGQNGVGKTTLLNILTNCIKNYSGDVNILGKKIKNDNLIRNNIGYMPEKNDLLLNMKLIDIYLYSARINNVKKVEAIHRIDIILKWLNLEKWSNIELKKFSSGMRQKAYLGRCLIHNPEILILDEPTSKLDPLFRKDILNILIQLNKQGKTLLISSHDLKNLESICTDYFIMLKKGKLSYYENNKMNKTGNLLINTSNNIKLINYLKSINIPILEITEEYIKINNENNLNFLYNFLTYNNDVQIINYNFEKNSMEQNLFSELSREE